MQKSRMGKTHLMYKKAGQLLKKYPNKTIWLVAPEAKKKECKKRFKEINPNISQQELNRLYIASSWEM